MKKLLTAVILFMSFIGVASAQENTPVVPPLKLDESIIPEVWSVHNLPSNIFTLPDPAEGATTEHEIMEKVAADIAEYASQFIGTRYRYGSTGPKTFDCSGFMSYIFKNAGIKLSRTSKSQYAQGQEVAHDDIRPGDLVFFSSPRSGKGRVGHVGMVVNVNDTTGAFTFIHASTSKGVSYSSLPDDRYFNSRYIGAKRVINAS